MKRHQLKDIFPPKVKILKNKDQLEVHGNEELINDNHSLPFRTLFGFEVAADKNKFIKKSPSDLESDIKEIVQYLREYMFEVSADQECQVIINKLDRRENESQIARRIGKDIKSGLLEDITIPNFSKTRQLKQYQIKSVQHMIKVPHAANFSIPGSGKTTMTYAAYSVLKSDSKIDQLFVVGPLSSFKPWEEEFTNCFGVDYNKKVLRYAGTKPMRKRLLENIDDYDVVLTSVGVLAHDQNLIKEIFKQKKLMLVIDESHHIKSIAQNATYTNTMIDIGKYATKRIILTGTPMPYDWQDLWSQITFLYPDEQFLGTRESYKLKIDDVGGINSVINEIKPLWSRVSYKQMASDLPKIDAHIKDIPMSPIQNKIYLKLESEWLTLFENESYYDVHALTDLKRAKTLRLLQSITNPSTITRKDNEFDLTQYETEDDGFLETLKNYKEVPNKVAYAAEKATKLANEGKNVIIWVVFVHNVNYLCDLLHEMNPIGVHGEIKPDNDETNEIVGRDELINRFKNNKGQIMVATLGSIAESVSLHRNSKGEPVCQNAIYLERNFNAGQFMQSLFRIYRIGSDRNLSIQNTFLRGTLIGGSGTIDNEIHNRLEQRKKRMFNMMNDDMKLESLNVDANNYKKDQVTQFYDSDEDENLIFKRIHKMIKRRKK